MTDFAILGLGMHTALGGTNASCAAARGRLSAICQLEEPLVSDPVSLEMVGLRGHAVSSVRGFAGLARHVLLAATALQDLLASWTPSSSAGLVVAVPNAWAAAMRAATDERSKAIHRREEEERRASYEQLFFKLLEERCEMPRFARKKLHFGGQASAVEGLKTAGEWLADRSVDCCVVGGVDSTVEPAVLEALLELEIAASPMNPAGLCPGEGAAFVGVTRIGASRSPARALVREPTAAHDRAPYYSDRPLVGEGLREAFARLPDPLHSVWIADLNGEETRARDFGAFLGSCPKALAQAPVVPLGASFGDLGAATGGAAIALATRAFERRYARGSRACVVLSEPTGARGMFMVEASQ